MEGVPEWILEVKLTNRHLKNCYLANVRKASDNVKYFAPHTVVYITPKLQRLWFLSFARNSPYFMEPEGSIPHSQEPVTFTYPEPDKSNICPVLCWESILIFSFHVRLGFPIVSFPQVTMPKPYMHLYCTSYGLRDEFVHLTLNSVLKETRGQGTANINCVALCEYFNMNDQNHSIVSFAVFRGSLSLWTQI